MLTGCCNFCDVITFEGFGTTQAKHKWDRKSTLEGEDGGGDGEDDGDGGEGSSEQ